MVCPKYDTENTDQAESIKRNENLRTEEQHPTSQAHTDETLTPPTKDDKEIKAEVEQEAAPRHHQRITDLDFKSDAAVDKPVVSRGLNIAIIIFTMILPIIGVIMGFTYLRKEHPEARKAGKNWLILGGIMIVVNILLIKGM